MNEWWVVMTVQSGRIVYWNDEHRWWCDYEGATLYGTKEQAEAEAFSAVSRDKSLIGCVSVQQMVGRGA